ncbi:MAG: Holliday junction branch migration protein RuvA [Verrucomicrobia bacterium]|nr:Holliday junction branch migration protein RuvA [Verrucomicrobiota bacterium]
MFEYIKGTLTEATPSKVTLETHGVGYLLFIPLNNYAKLPKVGSPLTLYVSTVIREDSHKNYGFLTTDQRDLFESLIEVSGIGPKTALALLGHMEINDLQFAIVQGNTPAICKIPGIGKKTAERLVIELRDKVKKFGDKSGSDHPLSSSGGQGVIGDAISALVNLGYNPVQAQKAIKAALGKSEEEPELAKLITSALRCI